MIYITIISPTKLKTSNVNKLSKMIFKNFKQLENYNELNHNMKEIMRLLKSDNTQLFLILRDKKIIAYLIGELIKLKDGRNVFYVSYLYTAENFRKNGHAKKLMKSVFELSKKNNLDGIMLTCDTENAKVYNMYLMMGFMPDMILRRYSKYDVLYSTC